MHRSVAAVEHHVRVADGREIAGAVHQQQGHVVCDFENAMDQPAGKVTLLRVDEHARKRNPRSGRRPARDASILFSVAVT